MSAPETLLIHFASAAELDAAAHWGVLSALIPLLLISVVVWALAPHVQPRLKRRHVLIGAAGVTLASVLWIQHRHAERFGSLQANGDGLTLQHAGASVTALSAAQVLSIEYGSAGRSIRRCHLSVLTTSGQRYLSVTVPHETSQCRAWRKQVLQALGR